MEHEFGNSYGMPFVGDYTPPPCSFNRVTMNFTVTSKGRQFDRLGLMYLGDVEVFRTSTAEPTTNGIFWSYTKEMDQYNALWSQDQKIIFDLGNVIDDTYTGPYFTTLTATFFTVPDTPSAANTILPISAKQSAANTGSAFIVPDQNATVSYTFPQNAEKAVISLSACGQIAEEFWYTNVFSSDTDTFDATAGTLGGYGPFREVQLLIDGQLAGVSWPFPIIFTGGIVPGFWRPIVGIDAFDLRQQEIDVTPWLGVLCDGAAHSFEIRVAGLNDDGNDHASISETVGSYWVVTGTIFLFLGNNTSVTTGTNPSVDAAAPDITISSAITTNSTGANETLTYNTEVTRNLAISSTIKTSTGSRQATWTQTLSYKNFNALTSQGFVQYTQQNTSGTDSSSSGYIHNYNYPLTVNSSFSTDASGSVGINATIDRGLDYNIYGPSVFPSGLQTFNVTSPSTFIPGGSTTPVSFQLPFNLPVFGGSLLSTTQTGSAKYFSGTNSSYSFGTTEQDFDFQGMVVDDPTSGYELYHRHVLAVNSSIVEDEQTFAGQNVGVRAGSAALAADEFPVLEAATPFSVRALLGRGPGQPKPGISVT
ncbi:hypothetical protein ACLMJK_005776 [Lecanora helva]